MLADVRIDGHQCDFCDWPCFLWCDEGVRHSVTEYDVDTGVSTETQYHLCATHIERLHYIKPNALMSFLPRDWRELIQKPVPLADRGGVGTGRIQNRRYMMTMKMKSLFGLIRSGEYG